MAQISFGMDDEVRILNFSSSKNFILIDKGSKEGIVENDIAIALLQNKISDSQIEIRPLLKLKSLKVYEGRSIFRVLGSYEDYDFSEDEKVILFTESKLLRGRADLDYSRTKFQASEDKIAKFTNEQLKRDNLHLASKEQGYSKERTLHEKDELFSSDIDLIDIDSLERKDDAYIPHSIYRSAYAKEFSEKKRLATFEKMVSAYIEKRSFESMDYSTKITSNENYFNKVLNQNIKDKVAIKKVSEEFVKSGPQWSDDYSDEELSELVTKMGMTRAILRQDEKILSRYEGHYFATFALNILDNENSSDPNNHQDNRYSIEFGGEFFSFKNYDSFINKFTVGGSFRKSQDGFQTNTYNALIDDYSLRGFINYYPLTEPTALKENIFFLGIGMRLGFANLKIPDRGESGSYQLLSFPSFETGIKYSFLNGYGMKMGMTFEKINLLKMGEASGQYLTDNLSYLEGKIGFTLTKLF